MDNNKDSSIKEKAKYKHLKPIIKWSIAIVLVFWTINMVSLGFLDANERGTLGDMFGAVNAIFSGLAFAGIIVSLYMQRIDLQNQQEQIELNYEEIRKTNEEFELQNKTLSIQLFENQYYKMIDLHKANVEEFSIPFFDLLDGSITSRDNKQIEQKASNIVLREVTGKKGFVDMYKELEVCIYDSVDILNKSSQEYDYEEILLFAYKIFFWGVYSDFAYSDIISNNDQIKVKRLLKHKQKQFKSNLVKEYKQDINTRYVPFQGHESRLAHYYRHLFQTVKYVVQQEEKGLIEYQQTRQYLRVLRAQLSNAEQLLLYYNYRCGFGKNWDYLGTKGYQFLTKYRMIHNIPINRVINVVENPRKHFKIYIKKYCTDEDTLFEWGDYDN